MQNIPLVIRAVITAVKNAVTGTAIKTKEKRNISFTLYYSSYNLATCSHILEIFERYCLCISDSYIVDCVIHLN